MSTRRALNVTREQDFPAWYQAVVREADLAEVSPVRGCMIIKPWGYGIWELIQAELDRGIKALGNDNCYFPIFIPLSFVAGIWGMNFDPDSSPFNMPELRWRYGYPFALALMLLILLGLLIYFWRKGWLKR